MKEILPGLYQLVLPLPGFSPNTMNVYLFREREGFTIIDTGWDTPELLGSVKQQLSEFHFLFSDIKRVLLTHCHVDHLGMIGRYKKENQARIYLPGNETGLIKIRFSHGDTYWPMTEKFLNLNGMPDSELTPTKFQLPGVSLPEPDVLLEGGETIPVGDFNLTVVNTPGHTPGHAAYYEPQKKLLFCGDVLLPTIVTNAALHVQHIVNPLRQYLDSIQVLQKLDVDLVLPGHEYIFSGHRERIDELIRQNLKKSRNIFSTFRDSSPKTAYEVSQALCWSPETKTNNWSKLSDWDKRFAVLQTIAHLDDLAFSGKLVKIVQNDKVYYQKK